MSPPDPVFLSHASSREHDTGAHPERIDRIVAVLDELRGRDFCGYRPVESPVVAREVLELVHPPEYVAALERIAAGAGGRLDPDTVMSAGSFAAALHGCGGAVDLASRIVAGGAGAVGFSAHRPPGHHALPERPMGFCLLNSVAVAARWAIAGLGLERVMVLDWDVHHGNGTNDIFWESDEVLFVSIHQWPLWPGSGRVEEVGEGAGRGYTVNLPLAPGSGDAAFVSLVRDVAVPLALLWRPQLVLVSAGYDAHRADPLADCTVTEAGFAAMTWLVRELGMTLGVGVGCLLEGGYDVRALASSVAVTMEVLAGADGGTPGSRGRELVRAVELSRQAAAARSRLAEWWPDLSA